MGGFGREKAWLGAALAAFGVGCGEGNEGRGTRDEGDKKDVKIEKAPEEILAQDEVIDEELVVRRDGDTTVQNESGQSLVERKVDVAGNVERPARHASQGEAGGGTRKGGENIELESRAFRNVLMEEADGKRPGDWMGERYDAEVARLKEKLPRELWKNKFSNSPEQLHKFFVPSEDETKDSVLGLLNCVKEGKKTKYFLNKEYRDNVKLFAEKYGEQYKVPIEVIYGVVAVENDGKHDPRKNKADDAYGIMQVQPGVVEHLKSMKFNGEDWSEVSVQDLEGNIRAGVAYLDYLNKRYNQRWPALMAYNAGPAAFERDMVSFSDGSLADRAKLRGDIRDLKKQIKEEKKKKEVDEEVISVLEEQLKIKQEEFGVQNEHLDQLRADVAKGDGWKVFLSNKNLWWACSKSGGTFYANSNARYVVEAMYLGKPMQEIMQSQDGEVKLTPLTDGMK